MAGRSDERPAPMPATLDRFTELTAAPAEADRRGATSTGVEALLPLLADACHRLLGLRLSGPDSLEHLGEEVAALVDGEIGSRLHGDLALGREGHAVDER